MSNDLINSQHFRMMKGIAVHNTLIMGLRNYMII